VPGRLTLGALKSPWVLQPVFAGFSILSPSWLWIDIPVLIGLVAAFTWAVSGRRMLRVRRVPAWHSATIGVEGADSYTAFGYANPTRRVLANVLHTRAEVRVLAVPGGPTGQAGEAPAGAPHLGYSSDVIEVVETYLYRPGFRLVMRVVATAKRLQSGRRQNALPPALARRSVGRRMSVVAQRVDQLLLAH
jgi:hydrogenase-4 component B